MKRIVLMFLVVSAILTSCKQPSEGLKVIVENPSGFERADLVEIPLDSIKEKMLLTHGQTYIVTDDAGNVITSQITSDSKLIFQPNLGANQSVTYTVKSGEAQTYEAQTFARFITERKDDFAWENDRVAFRIYGPALVETDGPSNGIDAWFKRTNALIVDKWYKNDLEGVASYHEDHGEGLDDYKVGRSLGAGAMAPYVDGKLWLNENFVSQELIDNGPLRSTFKLTYKDIDVNGKAYTETRTISIDAGSQLSKITEEYGFDTPTEVAAGIVKREKDSIITSLEDNYIVYAEPASEKVGNIYLALVFPDKLEKSIVDVYKVTNSKDNKEYSYSHILGVITYKPNTPVTYYTGYGWSKFGFETVSDFQKYIENFSKSLQQPLVVKY